MVEQKYGLTSKEIAAAMLFAVAAAGVIGIWLQQNTRFGNLERRAAEECLDHHLGRFKHPDTVEMYISRVAEDHINIAVSAEDPFGARSRGAIRCPTKDGRFDYSATLEGRIERLRELEESEQDGLSESAD